VLHQIEAKDVPQMMNDGWSGEGQDMFDYLAALGDTVWALSWLLDAVKPEGIRAAGLDPEGLKHIRTELVETIAFYAVTLDDQAAALWREAHTAK
jgi:hypothetical protein